MPLPQGYTVPEGSARASRYMKFQDGKNKFRILSDIVTGWEWFSDEDDGKRTPARVKTYKEVPAEVLAREDDKAKHFWAMVVRDYADDEIKILEITQKTVQKDLASYEGNEDWGDLTQYDVTVERKGKDRDTTYSTVVSPKKEVPVAIMEAYEKASIDLEKLFTNENPFGAESGVDMDQLVTDFDGEVPDLDKPKKK